MASDVHIKINEPGDSLEEDDPVNPSHYRDLGLYSALHVVERWGLGFHLGQAVKYIQRAGKKQSESEITDLKKAVWYIQRYIYKLDSNEFDPAEDYKQFVGRAIIETPGEKPDRIEVKPTWFG